MYEIDQSCLFLLPNFSHGATDGAALSPDSTCADGALATLVEALGREVASPGRSHAVARDRAGLIIEALRIEMGRSGAGNVPG